MDQQQVDAQKFYDIAKQNYVDAGGRLDNIRKGIPETKEALKPYRESVESAHRHLQQIRRAKKEANIARNQQSFSRPAADDGWEVPGTPSRSVANSPDRDLFHREKEHAKTELAKHRDSPDYPEYHRKWMSYLGTLYAEITGQI